MADDLKLEIVIQALLDEKGFEEAKANLEGLTATANKSAPAISATGTAVKRMGESYGGTRGPVADVTRVLLMNVGVTGAAGEAAKAAGTAMYFMEGAATAANVAISASVAAVALLLPLLVSWFKANKDNEGAQKDFNDQLDIGLNQLEEVIQKAPEATRELQGLLGALRSERARAQTDALTEMREEIVKIDARLKEARGTVERYEQAVSRGFTAAYAPAEEARKTIEKETEARTNLLAKAHAIEQALLDGKTAGEQAAIITDTLAEADRKAALAAERHARELERLNEAKRKAAQEQEDQARIDIVGFTEREQKKRRKAQDDEVKRILDYQDVLKDQQQLEKDIAEEKRINALNAVGYAAQGLGALSVLFRGNKALAIEIGRAHV